MFFPCVVIVRFRSVPEDPVMLNTVQHYYQIVAQRMHRPVGLLEVPLDSAVELVRVQECALGNLAADMIREVTKADISAINGGCMRGVCCKEPGVLTWGNIDTFFPMLDSIAVLEVTLDELVPTLENGVSRFPSQDGRFLHVSGMAFTFDPSRPAGSRVINVLVDGEAMVSSCPFAVWSRNH